MDWESPKVASLVPPSRLAISELPPPQPVRATLVIKVPAHAATANAMLFVPLI
jgi:hypothetical protein